MFSNTAVVSQARAPGFQGGNVQTKVVRGGLWKGVRVLAASIPMASEAQDGLDYVREVRVQQFLGSKARVCISSMRQPIPL